MNIQKILLQKKKFILFYVLLTFAVLCLQSVGFSKYSSQIIQDVTHDMTKNTNRIIFSFIAILFIWFFTEFVSALKYYMNIKNDIHFKSELKKDLFDAYLKKYTDTYQESNVGEIITRMERIPTLFYHIFENVTTEIIPYSLAILFLVIYFGKANISIGIAAMCLVFAISFSIFLFYPYVKNLMIRENISREQLNDSIFDRTSRIFHIIAENKQSKESSHFKNKELNHRQKRSQLLFTAWKFYALMDVVIFIFAIIFMYLFYTQFKFTNAFKLPEKTFQLQTLTTAFLVMFSFLAYVDNTKHYIVESLISYSAVNRIHEDNKKHFATDASQSQKSPLISLENLRGIIEIKNLDFCHTENIAKNANKDGIRKDGIRKDGVKKKCVFKNFSAIFYPNRINGIFGKSGSGKTTLTRLLLGVWKPEKEAIYFDGIPHSHLTQNQLSSLIGVISQDLRLHNQSILQNLDTTETKFNETLKTMQLTEFFKTIDIFTPVGVGGTLLSQGQKQIIFIVKLFLENKKIWLCDEPTASLDEYHKKVVMESLHRAKKNGKTILIVSHDPYVMQNVDRKIYIG